MEAAHAIHRGAAPMATSAMSNGSADSASRSSPNAGERPHPVRDGPPDLVGRILLEEMEPRDLHLVLRAQPAGEVEIRAADDEQTGLGLHEQLGHVALRQPVRVGGRDRRHVGGLAVDGDLPGPRQRRPSPGSANGRRYSTISSAERVRRMAPGRIFSMKKFSCKTIASPASERNAFKAGRMFKVSQWSQACGRTIASMYAMPFTASRCRLAQSKPSAEPQS